ncbi:hypothetical protein LEP1GSC188_0554 [Leptospira weilii serovar Topaz str. LT2116]|uniref:PF09926 repeat protein n=1 Tax=Leptospira weilii serovar Topaz str. LT2116 TaxID=1088540 RepID=M3GVB5_9LEPT|nr:hypothetical protein LEP1GSC188_0554 [Leptospira weilii serovar Topaz str. LT2116]
MEENKSKQGYALGEAVRDKVTGQKMYVDAAWSPEIKCVYYNTSMDELIKVEVPYEDLEKIMDLDFNAKF